MQISFVPHTQSSFSLKNNSQNGFTLVELLISVGIITVVSTIVLLKYSSFDSGVLLKNTAYEVALALREAQAKSVSGSHDGGGDARYPFGVTFTPDSKKYTIFRFASSTGDPYYDVGGAGSYATGLSTTTIERSMYVSDVCVNAGGADACDSDDSEDISHLDISFRRPEFRALFHAEGYSGTQANIQSAKIKVGSTNGTDVFVVEVSRLGQISVTVE